jgi:hypothetical protein
MALDYSKVTERQRFAIDDVMDNFDFDAVETHMNQTSWEWATTKNGKVYMEVPDKCRIKFKLRQLLVEAFTKMSVEKERNPNFKGPFYISTAGFTVLVWENDTCQVFFSVSDWWVDEDIFEYN